ncbi:EndoU domain-containing protein [Undibacterium luofuense]|uniref:EndoU domain-containing protein n=1 Tax=Undibacterium luofuense TaxID=2828733 RepID=A0A941DIJ7_9BURK|nr:EndoU domain-containing protein [Undibacterium luofuense]MBR7781592.1 EndoU domain-containing protein [Undibacterium luofuense]
MDRHGIYEAKVEVLNAETGEWIPKKASSTFFPKEWTPERLNAEVLSAFENKTWVEPKVAGMPRSWIGMSESGVRMKGHFLNGKIDTVYPILGGK